jgi:hypothetical protein
VYRVGACWARRRIPVGGAGSGAGRAQAPAAVAPADTAALRAQYEQWRKDFKTWGKFAPVGQETSGTSSLITPQKVQSAMKLVKSGIVVSLAHAEPQEVAADVGAGGIFHRVTNGITDGGTTDNYQVSFHGQTVAHIDSWCHFFENGQMYNGVPVKDNLSAEAGCKKGSVMNWKDGITTRAVPLRHRPAERRGTGSTPTRRSGARTSKPGRRNRCEDGARRHPLLYIGRWKRRAALGPWTGQVRATTRHDSVDARPSALVHRTRLQH